MCENQWLNFEKKEFVYIYWNVKKYIYLSLGDLSRKKFQDFFLCINFIKLDIIYILSKLKQSVHNKYILIFNNILFNYINFYRKLAHYFFCSFSLKSNN